MLDKNPTELSLIASDARNISSAFFSGITSVSSDQIQS